MTESHSPSSSHPHTGSHSAEELLPLLYNDLRKIAAARMSRESPGQTLEPTALVNEAWLRLAESDEGTGWDGRGHFFAAAVETMRRILIDRARRKGRIRHGGDRTQIDLESCAAVTEPPGEELLMLDDALKLLADEDADAARVVELRYFAGLTIEETAAMLSISVRKVNRDWGRAKTRLHEILYGNDSSWNQGQSSLNAEK